MVFPNDPIPAPQVILVNWLKKKGIQQAHDELQIMNLLSLIEGAESRNKKRILNYLFSIDYDFPAVDK